MAYKQNNPFSRKSIAEKFAERNEALLDDARQSVVDLAGYRGRDTYGEAVKNAHIRSPYAKAYGTDKKYPYLSSRHHRDIDIHNPMKTSFRRSEEENGTYTGDVVLTIAEERKRDQDRLLGGTFPDERSGTTYYGPEFNKAAEKAARTAVERHEYLTNAAAQGEEALNAALSNENVINKHGVVIGQEMPVRSEFPISTQDTGSATNLAGGYAPNPSGHSLKNIHQFQDLADRAVGAQDLTDALRQTRERMRYFDSSEGLNERSGKNYFNIRSGNKY